MSDDNSQVDLDLPDVIEDDPKPARRPKPSRRKPPTSAALDATTVRRVAAKLREVEAAPERHRKILSSLLGLQSDDPLDLTVGVLTSKDPSKAAADLLSVAEADPLEAGILVMTMEKAQVRGVWRLAADLGMVGAQFPPSEGKAALQLVKSVIQMTPEQRDELAAADALVSKA